MKTVTITSLNPLLDELLSTAKSESILIEVSGKGQFILEYADDFDEEVKTLSESKPFTEFLNQRMNDKTRIPISKIASELGI